MKHLFWLLLLVSGIASAQYTPTGSKTRFVNGIGLGTKSDAAFGTVDSLVLYASADSTLKFKYKGTARALAFASQLPNDSLGVLVRLKAGTSGGIGIYANNWTQIAQLGAGGSAAASFYGFAGYNSNQGSSYTARSFTDKNYVDSVGNLKQNLFTQGINGYIPKWTSTSSLDTSSIRQIGSSIFMTGRLNINGASDVSVYAMNANGYAAFNSPTDWIVKETTGSGYGLYKQTSTSVSIKADNVTRFIVDGDVLGKVTVGSSSGNGTGALYSGSGTFTENVIVGSSATNLGGLLVKGGSSNGTPSASSGQIEIGATPAYHGSVSYDDNTGKFYLDNYYNNAAGGIYLRTKLAGTTVNALSIDGNGSTTLSSLGTGTVYSNSGTFTNTNPSDSTIKNNIKPLGYGLAEILKLQPKTFYYNSDSAKSSLKYGFIAQDVQKIMPDMVRKFNVSLTSDSSGVKVTKQVEKLGLETDGIYVTLVKAIQEQQAIIDDLKKRIIALENK